MVLYKLLTENNFQVIAFFFQAKYGWMPLIAKMAEKAENSQCEWVGIIVLMSIMEASSWPVLLQWPKEG